ncbi:hypothetical protein HN451_07535 [archaeon]|nr:hypothetical protein [archaeon]
MKLIYLSLFILLIIVSCERNEGVESDDSSIEILDEEQLEEINEDNKRIDSKLFLNDNFAKIESLKESEQQFFFEPRRKSQDNPNAIYVGQRMYAITSSISEKTILQTSRAGPCIILILYDSNSKIGILAHIDSGTLILESMNNILNELFHLGADLQNLNAKLFGGWITDSNGDYRTSEDIINYLKEIFIEKSIKLVEEDTLNYEQNDFLTVEDLSHGTRIQFFTAKIFTRDPDTNEEYETNFGEATDYYEISESICPFCEDIEDKDALYYCNQIKEDNELNFPWVYKEKYGGTIWHKGIIDETCYMYKNLENPDEKYGFWKCQCYKELTDEEKEIKEMEEIIIKTRDERKETPLFRHPQSLTP